MGLTRAQQRAHWAARHRDAALPARTVPSPQTPTARVGPAVDVHIGALAFNGPGLGAHRRIAEAVRQQLTSLLSEGGVPAHLQQSVEIARLDAGSFVVGSSKPDAIGSQIARLVYEGPRR